MLTTDSHVLPNRQNRSIALGVGILLILALTPYWAGAFGGSYVVSLVMKAMIFAIASLSLNLLIDTADWSVLVMRHSWDWARM